MEYTTGTPRPVRIEWQYGLTALMEMTGLSLPRYFRPQVIDGHADWSERFRMGRVLQLAMSGPHRGFENLGCRPSYVRPGRSALDFLWTKQYGTVRKETIGHPTILNRDGQVVQSEVFVDRSVELMSWECHQPEPRRELEYAEFTHQVSETTEVELVPFHFTLTPKNERGNPLAIHIAIEMNDAGYRPATLTEVIWYATKYENEIAENQFLVPWSGYSGGFSEGRQRYHHLGLPTVTRRQGALTLTMSEFLGQHMPVSKGVEYLAVKI